MQISGIKSILLYSPGLTCQKVHLENDKKICVCVCVFHNTMISHVSVCPLFCVCAPHTVMKHISYVCYLTLHWFMNNKRQRGKLRIKDEGRLQREKKRRRMYLSRYSMYYIIITTQCTLWMHQDPIKSWRKGDFVQMWALIMDVSLSICVSDCVYTYLLHNRSACIWVRGSWSA